MKVLTIKQTGYRITGIADLTPWGGGNACIPMESFTVKHLREIRRKINDNGFGVEAINGAICNVSREYEKGVTEYSRTLWIGKISDNTVDYYQEN